MANEHCTVCNYYEKDYSQLFDFVLVDGEYVVTRYKGTDTIVTVPSRYNGKDITTIKANAFSACGYYITDLIIEKGITTIEEGALIGCSALRTLSLPQLNCHFAKLFDMSSTTLSVAQSDIYPSAVDSYTIKVNGVNRIFGIPRDGCSWYYNGTLSDGRIYCNDELTVLSSKQTYETTVGVYWTLPTSVRIKYYQLPTYFKKLTITDEAISLNNSKLSGCSDYEIEIQRVEIKTITIADVVSYIDEFDVNNYSFTVKYTNDTSNTVNDVFNYIENDNKALLSTVGEHELSLCFEGVTFKWNLTLNNHTFSNNVQLTSQSYYYDGDSKSLAVENLPDGANVQYINNGQTEIGVYDITATITKPYYDDLQLQATLTIKQDVYSITYNNLNGVENNNPDTFNASKGLVLNNLEKLNYVFVGWYKDSQFKTKIESIPLETEENITLYAQWKSIFQLSGNSIVGITDYGKTYTEIIIDPIIEGVNIRQIGESAFANCKAMTKITIPDTITTIGASAFANCNKLIKIDFKGEIADWCNISFGNSSANPLYYAHNLYVNGELVTELEIPDGVTEIKNCAFCGCTSITSVTIPDSVQSIGYYAFDNCGNLIAVYYTGVIADWCNISFGGYGANPLYYAHNLYINNEIISGDIVMPNGVTTIPSYTFKNSAITSITIPNSVTSIDGYAFDSCNNLTAVYYAGTVGDWCKININSNPMSYAQNLYINNEIISGDIVLPDGVTTIPMYTFKNSTITSITIPNSVKTIGGFAFQNCNCLTGITVPNSVTSIGSSAFSGCSSLESITLPFVGGSRKTASAAYQYPFGYIFGTSSYTGGVETEQRYYGPIINGNVYTEITNYYIPLTLKSVTITGGNILYGAFYGCSGLTSTTVSDSVTLIAGFAFYDCNNLTSITMGKSVTSIVGNAFVGCDSLATVYYTGSIADWCNISFGNNYANPLYYAHNLYINNELVTKLDIPDGVTEIKDYAFSGCASITSVTIPDSIKWIGKNAFYKCTSLICASIRNGLKTIGENVFSCSGLTSIIIPDSVTSIGEAAFSSCNSLASVIIGNGVRTIDDVAFASCRSLINVTIGNSVTSIGVDAFYYCIRLVEVYNLSRLTIVAGSIDNGYVASYAKIVHTSANEASKLTTTADNYLFYADDKNVYLIGYIGNETELILPNNFNDRPYAINKYAFAKNDSLTSITIPDSVTSIGSYAFEGCSNLTNIIIPDSVISLQSAFGGCSSLQYNEYDNALYLGNTNNPYLVLFKAKNTDITTCEINENTKIIYSSAFYNCSKLTSITIPNSVTSINDGAFSYCSNLISIKFGNNVVSTGYQTFAYCRSLTSIALGNNVNVIGNYAFCGCSNLTSIIIPESVTSVIAGAFYDCSSLKSVYYKGNANTWAKISLSSSDNANLIAAAKYYYSETQPTTSGRYWHYDDNGDIVVW
ncbi:MAG: leucine-rich repeat protein [Corallococcus sp.]|nr:leucine-rich repeat protein [Corallococcus sp.]